MLSKHFVDSVSCAADKFFNNANNVIDIGTGAGFPGIPLAIIAPDKEFLLADSLNKRVKILKQIIEELGINNVSVVHGRAEELAKQKQIKRGVIAAENWSAVENAPGVFAGGDCVTGPATAIRAIAAGKVAAANIDAYLGYNHEIRSDVEI